MFAQNYQSLAPDRNSECSCFSQPTYDTVYDENKHHHLTLLVTEKCVIGPERFGEKLSKDTALYMEYRIRQFHYSLAEMPKEIWGISTEDLSKLAHGQELRIGAFLKKHSSIFLTEPVHSTYFKYSASGKTIDRYTKQQEDLTMLINLINLLVIMLAVSLVNLFVRLLLKKEEVANFNSVVLLVLPLVFLAIIGGALFTSEDISGYSFSSLITWLNIITALIGSLILWFVYRKSSQITEKNPHVGGTKITH